MTAIRRAIIDEPTNEMVSRASGRLIPGRRRRSADQDIKATAARYKGIGRYLDLGPEKLFNNRLQLSAK